jgi:hypothetical protein
LGNKAAVGQWHHETPAFGADRRKFREGTNMARMTRQQKIVAALRARGYRIARRDRELQRVELTLRPGGRSLLRTDLMHTVIVGRSGGLRWCRGTDTTRSMLFSDFALQTLLA